MARHHLKGRSFSRLPFRLLLQQFLCLLHDSVNNCICFPVRLFVIGYCIFFLNVLRTVEAFTTSSTGKEARYVSVVRTEACPIILLMMPIAFPLLRISVANVALAIAIDSSGKPRIFAKPPQCFPGAALPFTCSIMPLLCIHILGEDMLLTLNK
jgi:hypothetical protein